MTLDEIEKYLQERGVEVNDEAIFSKYATTILPTYPAKVKSEKYVYLQDLLPLFENAKAVYEMDDPTSWTVDMVSSDGMHQALLIDIRPIKQKEPIEEACELMHELYGKVVDANSSLKIEAFLAKHGVKR